MRVCRPVQRRPVGDPGGGSQGGLCVRPPARRWGAKLRAPSISSGTHSGFILASSVTEHVKVIYIVVPPARVSLVSIADWGNRSQFCVGVCFYQQELLPQKQDLGRYGCLQMTVPSPLHRPGVGRAVGPSFLPARGFLVKPRKYSSILYVESYE